MKQINKMWLNIDEMTCIQLVKTFFILNRECHKNSPFVGKQRLRRQMLMPFYQYLVERISVQWQAVLTFMSLNSICFYVTNTYILITCKQCSRGLKSPLDEIAFLPLGWNCVPGWGGPRKSRVCYIYRGMYRPTSSTACE